MLRVQSCQAKQLKLCTKSSRSLWPMLFETLPRADAKHALQCCRASHHSSYAKHNLDLISSVQAALSSTDARARLELVNQLTDYVSDALAEVNVRHLQQQC